MKHGSRLNLGFLLNRAAALWDRRLMEQFKEKGVLDMKPSFGSVFIPLFDKDGISAKEMAEFSKLTKQTLSTYIKELEARKYISRRKDKNDGRFEKIFLTKKGKKLQRAANEAVKKVNLHFQSKISKKKTDELLKILESITK
jgi:DNA-binding MarR family transcriptional regulator